MREEQQKRFWREVALTGKLSNPHTVRLIDSGFMPGSAWQELLESGQIKDVRALETIQRFVGEDASLMVLELVQGQSSREALTEKGAMSAGMARRICGHVLEALSEAHSLEDIGYDGGKKVKGRKRHSKARNRISPRFHSFPKRSNATIYRRF